MFLSLLAYLAVAGVGKLSYLISFLRGLVAFVARFQALRSRRQPAAASAGLPRQAFIKAGRLLVVSDVM